LNSKSRKRNAPRSPIRSRKDADEFLTHKY
jgi:hypothetical protein